MPCSDSPIYRSDTNKWEVIIFTVGDGEIIKTITKDNEKSALNYIKDFKSKEKKNLDTKMEQVLTDENSMLDELIASTALMVESNVKSSTDFAVSNQEQDQMKEDFKAEFEKQEKVAENKAKQLLLSIVKVYFDSSMITGNEYLKHKLEIEKNGLSSLIFQLDTSRRAIYKLSEQIHVSHSPSPRLYEVLTGLQRIILDISKFQHEYMTDLEVSMKSLSDDMSARNHSQATEDVPHSEVNISNKSELIKTLNKFISDTKSDTVIEKSRNKKINDDDSGLVESTTISQDDDSILEPGGQDDDLFPQDDVNNSNFEFDPEDLEDADDLDI